MEMLTASGVPAVVSELWIPSTRYLMSAGRLDNEWNHGILI